MSDRGNVVRSSHCMRFALSLGKESLIVHDTGVQEFFEYDKNTGGHPRGPVWFWRYGRHDRAARFCTEYSSGTTRGLRRRIIYSIDREPTLMNLSNNKAKANFLIEIEKSCESEDWGLKPLPFVISGRASYIDRWGSFYDECTPENRRENCSAFIRGYLEDKGYDGVYEEHGTVCLFKPENHTMIHAVYPVDKCYIDVTDYMNEYLQSDCKDSHEFHVKTHKSYPHMHLRAPLVFTLKDRYVAPCERCNLWSSSIF